MWVTVSMTNSHAREVEVNMVLRVPVPPHTCFFPMTLASLPGVDPWFAQENTEARNLSSWLLGVTKFLKNVFSGEKQKAFTDRLEQN